MNIKMTARPVDRYTSLSSKPLSTKYKARSPRRAKALAAKTKYGSWVTPKVAGIESSAKRRSVPPIAIITSNNGVATFRPSMTVKSLVPS